MLTPKVVHVNMIIGIILEITKVYYNKLSFKHFVRLDRTMAEVSDSKSGG